MTWDLRSKAYFMCFREYILMHQQRTLKACYNFPTKMSSLMTNINSFNKCNLIGFNRTDYFAQQQHKHNNQKGWRMLQKPLYFQMEKRFCSNHSLRFQQSFCFVCFCFFNLIFVIIVFIVLLM